MNVSNDRRKRSAPHGGTLATWPKGLEIQLGISAVTRWRWERDGKLPKRDVSIGGRTGWKPETIAAALSSSDKSSDMQ
jgi:predicted DNA-binding transcriptional regulator AlpA